MGISKGQKLKRGVHIDNVIVQDEFDEYMLRFGLNKKQACEKIGINPRTMDRMLSGKRVKTATTQKLKEQGFTIRIKKRNIVE